MPRRHDRDDMLRAALDLAFDEGLSSVSFGRVAKRLGISDRTVVYYFPTKDDLVTEVVTAMGARLQETLAAAFAEPERDHVELVRRAWPVVTTDDATAVFDLFFEANGLAAGGHSPYDDLVPVLVEAWVAWAAEFLAGTPEERRVEAETAVALIDGLLLLRRLAGTAAGDRAARRLGIA